MKIIDQEKWIRKNSYKMYKNFDFPFFNLTTNLEVGQVKKFARKNKIKLINAIYFSIVSTVNLIPELRTRIKDEDVVEYDKIDISFVIAAENNLYDFCVVPFEKDLNIFLENLEQRGEAKKNNPKRLSEDKEENDVIWVNCVPWISFTSIQHPIILSNKASIPVISIGKYFKQDEKLLMPFALQAHHGLVDGYHAGIFFNRLQEYFDRPEKLF
ncbi:MAG: CatA-like O-acetyltransferase [Pseudomonadota bacterium]